MLNAVHHLITVQYCCPAHTAGGLSFCTGSSMSSFMSVTTQPVIHTSYQETQISVSRLRWLTLCSWEGLPKCLGFNTVHTENLSHWELWVFWPISPQVSREWDSPVQFSGIWQSPSPTLQSWGQGGWKLRSLKPHSLSSKRFQTIFGGFLLATSLLWQNWEGMIWLRALFKKLEK